MSFVACGTAAPVDRKCCYRFAVLALLTFAVISTQLPAQTATATLFGTVRDQSGGILPGVNIQLLQQSTGIQRQTLTDPDGSFALTLLPAGRYTLNASLPGFKRETVRDIRLQVGVKSAIDILLTPGSADETVIVVADNYLLRPAGSALGQVLDETMLDSLPLNGREFMQLSLLTPGSAPPAQGSELSTQGSSGVNISGAREASNNFLLDGVDNNDLFLNRLVCNPSIDAIQEFTILANSYDAEYGRNAGAQVNVALKSGGQKLHGSFYEYFRHSGMDARNFFDDPDRDTPLLRFNQFGGTLGGALTARNFYFASFEGVRARRAETRTTNVPTVAERGGDFSATGQIVSDPFTGKPFDQNRIPAGRIDPVGAAIARLYPDPNRAVVGQNFLSSPIGRTEATQFSVKTDHHLSERNPIFFHYSFINDSRGLPFQGERPSLPGFGTAVLDRGQNFAVGTTRMFSAGMLNDFRFGFNRLRREVFPENLGKDGFKLLGIQAFALDPRDTGFPSVVLAGYESLGDDTGIPVVRRTGTFHFTDVLSLERGRHHLRVGGEIRHYRADGYNHLFGRGQMNFLGVFTGNALGDLLLGFPTVNIAAVNDNPQALRASFYNAFIQDDWKVTPNLTINLGLRYEYNQPAVDAEDRVSTFDVVSRQIVPVGKDGVPRSSTESDLNNFAPRIGLSWKVPGPGAMVLRAGYGVFYDSGTLFEKSSLYFNPPYFQLNLFFTGANPLRVSNPFPAERAFGLPPTPIALDRNYRTAYAQHFSFGLQGQSPGGVTLEARYVGTKGTKLFLKRNLNQPIPGPGDLDERRPIPGFSDILLFESAASSIYHSLQLRAEKRYSGGISFLGAYTLSRSIDTTSAVQFSDGDDNTPQNSRNIAAERGLSNFDLRQRLSWALTWDLPLRSQNLLVRGWQLGSILAVQSGRPFTPRLTFDNSNTGNVGGFFAHDRPNLLGDPRLSDPKPERFFNTSVFAVAPQYQFGNAGRNILTGPGFASLDLSLAKSFPIREDWRLQFRAEMYNALNRSNFRLPDGYVDRATFGRVLSAHPSRQFQLALRFAF